MIITLFVGYLIWSLIVYSRGQSPEKQLLKMRVVKLREQKSAGWGTMFLRELIAKSILAYLFGVLSLILDGWILFDAKHQELWDKMCGTIVVDDPEGVLRPGR
jgi:uncharacterized RDD family membrane protein YckC